MQYYIKCSIFAFGSCTVFKVTRVSVELLDTHMFLPKKWGWKRRRVSCRVFPSSVELPRSFLTLLDHHLATGFPEGDVSTRVSDAWSGDGRQWNIALQWALITLILFTVGLFARGLIRISNIYSAQILLVLHYIAPIESYRYYQIDGKKLLAEIFVLVPPNMLRTHTMTSKRMLLMLPVQLLSHCSTLKNSLEIVNHVNLR